MFLINLSFMTCVCFFMKIKSTTGTVTFENHTYREIDVAIGENVPYDPNLINQIKDMFSEGSKVLFKATHQKAHFGQVNIWVPSTWKVQQTGANTENVSLKSKDNWFEDADLRLDQEPHPIHGDHPYTLQPRGCGEPGLYMHFTTNYLRNSKQHGNPGRVLVHEWAHYRYGIFNEYSDSANPRRKFYLDSNKQIKPTLCPSHVKGWFSENDSRSCKRDSKGYPSRNCSFYPDSTSNANENVTVSLMSVPYLENVEFFCDDEQHNELAPTKHNELCDQASTWSIINSHPDFKNLTDESPVLANTTPEFRIYQTSRLELKQVVVALVDLSETMQKKIETVENALKSFVKHRLPENIEFAVIGYSSAYKETGMLRSLKVFQNVTTVKEQAEILKNIDHLSEEYDNEHMSKSNNKRPTGRALNNTHKYLKEQFGNLASASVLLITDGGTETGSYVTSVTDHLIVDELQVNFIALGFPIEPDLKRKIEETSGALYDVEVENDKSTIKLHQLDSALLKVASRIGPDQITPLRESTITLIDGEDWNGTFVAEKIGITSQTEVFVCAEEKKDFTLTIWNATAKVYGESSSCHFTNVQMIGEIFFSLNYTKPSGGHDNLTLSVIISSRSPKHQLIPERNVKQREIPPNVVHPGTPKAYLILTKGYYAPMIKAEVKFKACSTGLVNNSCETFDLRDDGQGVDNFANDGVYSGVTNYVKSNGSYSTSFTFRSVNDTITLLKKKIPRTGSPILQLPDENIEEEPTESMDPTSWLQAPDEDFDSEMDDIFADYEVETADHFSRESFIGSFRASNYMAVDTIKPAYVRDLTITDTSLSKPKAAHLVVSLEWTSSGDDEFKGIADYIEVRYDYNSGLRKNFERGKLIIIDHLQEGSLDPQEPLTKHSLKVEVKLYKVTHESLCTTNGSHTPHSWSNLQAESMAFVTHFVVQTCDKARNCEKSNVATAYYNVAFASQLVGTGLGIASGTLTLIAIFGIVFILVVSIAVVKIIQCQQNKLNKEKTTDSNNDNDFGSNVLSTKRDTYSNYSTDFTKDTEAAAQAAAVALVIEQAEKKRSKKSRVRQSDSLLEVDETRV